MKLLFDENLSPRLATELGAEFPQSQHVATVGLRGAADNQIWEFARPQDFTIVSKDTDFRERSFVEGFPPKIIWLAVGNAGTDSIAEVLRGQRQRIEFFEQQSETSLLIVSITVN